MDNELNLCTTTEQYKREIITVKALGDQIGYGNMMKIACSLCVWISIRMF